MSWQLCCEWMSWCGPFYRLDLSVYRWWWIKLGLAGNAEKKREVNNKQSKEHVTMLHKFLFDVVVVIVSLYDPDAIICIQDTNSVAIY